MVLLNSRSVSKTIFSTSAALFLMGISFSHSQANTIAAKSCSFSDVQSAINTAVSGDVITLPSGSSSWSGSLKINKTKLTILGKGVGSTIITAGTKSFALSGESANNLRISGIEFRGGSQLIEAEGSGSPKQAVKNFRVDHCKFVNTYLVIETLGGATGVFDHNEFLDSYGARLYGSNDPSPRPPYKLGTSDAIFWEDNKITVTSNGSPRHFIASNSFSKYVIRYNTFDYQKSLWDIIDAHGACEVIGRGSATWEIYENTIKLAPSLSRVIHLRGGQGVVFNNTFTGDYTPSQAINITDYAVCVGNCSQSCTTYPCPDMINHAYFWNNKVRTTPVNPINSCSNFIHLNRDYYNTPMPGYIPYAYPHPLTQNTADVQSGVTEQLKSASVSAGSISITPMIHDNKTDIAYSLDKNTFVKIAIYSIDGKLISSLVNKMQSAGNYSISWDATNEPSGLYLIKTSIGKVNQNFRVTK